MDLVASGAASGVVVTQEDCRPQGLHRSDQRRLRSRVAELSFAAPRFLLHPGADELSMVLLARVASEIGGHRGSGRVVVAPADSDERVAPFEDQPMRATIAGQMAAAGVVLSSDVSAPGVIVVGPLPQPWDLAEDSCGEVPSEKDATWTETLHEVATQMSSWPLVVADTAVASASYLPALRCLWQSSVRCACLSYVAWNTAGNTLGTAAAILSLLPLMEDAMERLRRFRLETLVDDAAY